MSRRRTTAAGVLTLTTLLTACGNDEPTDATTTTAPVTAPSASHPVPANPKGATMQVTLTTSGRTLTGTLEDTAAGRDFAALLPLTLTLSDHNGTERVADLPRRLSTTGAPSGATPRPGDIGYYAPWGNLALYYQDFPYSEGLVRLGRLDDGAAPVLAGLPEGARVTIAPG